jgi:hypothetical protein
MTAILEALEREAAHQQYRILKQRSVETATKFGPVDLPELPDDGERLFFSRNELLDFIRSGEYERRLDGHQIVTRLDNETSKYAVDVIPSATEPRETEGGTCSK